MDFDLKQLKRLFRLLDQEDVHEFEWTHGEQRLRVVRKSAALHAELSIGAGEERKSIPEGYSRQIERPVEVNEQPKNLHTVIAPIVGTFYRAPAPGAAPFVEEGDVVQKGATLCIIEAMKLMNEIEADVEGRVISILSENGQAVEYGMPLLLLETF